MSESHEVSELTGVGTSYIRSAGSNIDVFYAENAVELAQVRDVVESKLDPKWIKQREQGGTKLSYIGGHIVIQLLNKAFDYKWSYEIVSEEIVPSLPKAATKWENRKKVPSLDKNGQQIWEPQPPVAKVLGRLTVPGYGIKEQYGSKVIIGGATEQEASFKSASTDALKKCATLFGIGLELYGDDEDVVKTQEAAPQMTAQATPATQNSVQEASAPTNRQVYTNPYQKKNNSTTTAQAAPAKPETPPQGQPTNDWKGEDIARLKELKTILGVTDNTQLDPFVREFLDDKNATYMNVVPSNIEAFNIFLTKKAPMA